MTTITLTKHHGLGNDFLVAFDPPSADPAELAALSRQLCDRRRGIGADGLLFALAPPDSPGNTDGTVATRAATMVLYNADGSRAEMSGNGIRCFAQALARRLFAEHREQAADLTIYTDAGVRRVLIESTNVLAATIEATVDMGPVEPLAAPAGWDGLGCHPDRPVAHLSLGNPHSVVGVDDVDAVDLAALGAKVPHVNLEIVAPGTRPDEIRMRVHERGAGITQACGTGACAAAHAAARWGLATPAAAKLTVVMDGGHATVTLDAPSVGRVQLTGPATYVGTVTVDIEASQPT